MGSKLPARTALMAVVTAFCVTMSPPAKAQQPPPCTAPAAWFPHSQTPEQNSAGFPGNPNNCDFHQWSWNAFLWLTQTMKGELRFETFPPTGIETRAGVLDPLIGRSGQARTLELVQQAGPDGIMVDRQGHPIYYSIHSDSTFGNFITQNGLLDPAKLRAFDPDKSFPVNSLTLKAAWKVVARGEDVSTFYTRQAQIALLTVKDGKIVVSGKTKTARVALVAFHIAGAVNGHPEMIWATFEHVRNAPDLPKAMNEMAPNDIVSDKSWTFYRGQHAVQGLQHQFRRRRRAQARRGETDAKPGHAGLPHGSQRRRPQGEQPGQHRGAERLRPYTAQGRVQQLFRGRRDLVLLAERLEAELHVPARVARVSGPTRCADPDRLDPIVEHHGRDLHPIAERARKLLRLPQHGAGHVAELHSAVVAGLECRYQPRADQRVFELAASKPKAEALVQTLTADSIAPEERSSCPTPFFAFILQSALAE